MKPVAKPRWDSAKSAGGVTICVLLMLGVLLGAAARGAGIEYWWVVAALTVLVVGFIVDVAWREWRGPS